MYKQITYESELIYKHKKSMQFASIFLCLYIMYYLDIWQFKFAD